MEAVPDTGRRRAVLRPLQAAPFARLLGTYTVNRLGDAVGVVALALLVYAETHDPLAVSALFLAMEFLPAFFAPALVARIDQLSYRRTLPALYAIEGLLFGVLALLAQDFWLPAILAVAFVDGVLMLTGRGLTRAAVSSTLEPHGFLREGNGLLNLGFALAGAAGAAIGGVLVEVVGVSAALAVDGASFLLAAVVLLGARDLPAAHVDRQRFLTRIREGFGFTWRHRAVRWLLAGEAFALVLFTLIVPIEVVYARETLGTNAAGYGALLAAWGGGIVAGSVLFLRFASRSPLALLLLATATIGAAYLGMGMVDDLSLACALSVVGGMGNGVQWVSLVTAVQEATPANLQARVVGLLESVASATTGVGFLLGGLLVTVTDPPTAFLVAGSGLLVLVGVAAVVVRPRRPPAAPSGDA